MKTYFIFLIALITIFLHPVKSQSVFFSNQVHDFGDIDKRDTLTYTFELINQSNKIVQIKEVVAPCGACGCVTVDWDKKLLGHGKKVNVKVKFIDFPYSNFQRVIEVYYNTVGNINDNKVVLLEIKGQANIPSTYTAIDTSQKTVDSLSFIKTKKPKELNLSEIQKNIGYPNFAREYRIEEKIILKALIDEEGNYVKHLYPKEGNSLLISYVENHFCKIKFTPAMRGDKPIKFWVNVPFYFRIQ